MKKMVFLMVLLLSLCGCSKPAWETVEDVLPPVPVGLWTEEAYVIQIDMPEETQLTEEEQTWKIYSTDQGDFEIETRTFLAASASEAVKTISGYSEEELTILQTSRFDLPEYRFAWVTQTEQGSKLCRADLVMNGTECYAVICSVNETAGNAYEDQIRYVFSTFGLSVDEEV